MTTPPLPTLSAPTPHRALNATGDTGRSICLWVLAGLVLGVFGPGG